MSGVGPDALLGEEGGGFQVAMTAVERGRLGVAARSVGVAQACLDDTIAYAREREAFGHPIAEFQIVQSKITDMVVGTASARALTRECAVALQEGRRARQLTSIAKMHASDVAARNASDAVQIYGAAGVSPDHRVGRMYRDAKVLQIVEGSNDLHRALIGEIALGIRQRRRSILMRVTVIGAGIMGSGIAQLAAMAGDEVANHDVSAEQHEPRSRRGRKEP